MCCAGAAVRLAAMCCGARRYNCRNPYPLWRAAVALQQCAVVCGSATAAFQTLLYGGWT
ncbi:MAG: hypothetical protein KatS3mg055_1470 [Chloroflexus sp.]|nr:MAG: hypothetical protein KatS3mg055_1470 [Chloroflexus sp.]